MTTSDGMGRSSFKFNASGMPSLTSGIRRSKVGRPSARGHEYEPLNIKSDKKLLNQAGDHKVTVTLMDCTIGKQITRRGTAKMVGNYGIIYLDSLEGREDVRIVSEIGEKGRVIRGATGTYILSVNE
jgi:hypothetical protein